jgi:endoglucanase
LAINWANWSWGCSASFGNTFRVFSGTKSIVVDATQPWSAVSLRKGTALSTAGYSKVRFAIYTPNRARAFAFYTQSTDNGAASPVYNFVSTANTWTQVTVNLSDIGNPTSIKRINIQSMTGTAIGRHWMDAIELIP